MAAFLVPLQLLDPAWQLRLAGALINTAAFPLLGLALLQIAAELGPHDPQLKNRARLCSQLAVAGAASNAELNQQLQKLQGPVLGPADIAQPLPLLKAQVAAVLDQAALQITREHEASQPRTPLLLLPELLRNALASLAMALGFAPWPGGLAHPAPCFRSCRAVGGGPGSAALDGDSQAQAASCASWVVAIGNSEGAASAPQNHRLWLEGLRQEGVRISSCPQASPTSASTAATSPSLR